MSRKGILQTVAVGGAVALLGASILSLPLYLIIPAFFAYIAVRFNYRCMALGFVVAIGGIYLLSGLELATIALLLLAPPAIALSIIHRRKSFSFFSLVASCGAMLLGPALLFLAAYIATGKDIVTAGLDWLRGVFLSSSPESSYYQIMVTFGYFDSILDLPANMNLPAFQAALMGTTAINIPEFADRAIKAIRLIISASAPMITIFYSVIGGFLCFVTSRGLIKKGGTEIGKIPPFSKWELPKSFGFGSLCIIAVLYLGSLLNISACVLAFPIALYLFMLIYAIQGYSLITYFLKQNGVSSFAMGVVLVLILVLYSLLLVLMGVAEQMLRIRRRTENVLNKKK